MTLIYPRKSLKIQHFNSPRFNPIWSWSDYYHLVQLTLFPLLFTILRPISNSLLSCLKRLTVLHSTFTFFGSYWVFKNPTRRSSSLDGNRLSRLYPLFVKSPLTNLEVNVNNDRPLPDGKPVVRPQNLSPDTIPLNTFKRNLSKP